MNKNLNNYWHEVKSRLSIASSFVDPKKLNNFNLYIDNNEFGLAFEELFENSRQINIVNYWNIMLILATEMQLTSHLVFIREKIGFQPPTILNKQFDSDVSSDID